MFGSEILDVAIGLVFVYLLLSLLCSAIREGIAGLLKTRAVHLERGIQRLLQDSAQNGLAKTMYEHPLISSLRSGDKNNRWNLPSYIPSRNFALAFMDLVARGKDLTNGSNAGPAAPWISFDGLRSSVQSLGNVPLQRTLLSLIDTADGDLAKLQANIEAWYDSGMDRVSGWYKRRTQWVLLVIGLVASVLLNVDTIRIATTLYQDDAKREAIVAQAESAARSGNLQNENARQIYARLEGLNLPIGWPEDTANATQSGTPAQGAQQKAQQGAAQATTPQNAPRQSTRSKSLRQHLSEATPTQILGWLISAFAVTFGAPFWFDILNKIMVVRSTVKPHEKSPEESSEDRQLPSDSRQQTAQGRATAVNASRSNPSPGPTGFFQPQEWATGNPQEGVL
jgi:hypothetical protein